MTRQLMLVFSLGLIACADDPEPKNNATNNPTNNPTNNSTNNPTNNPTTPNGDQCIDFDAEDCPSPCVVRTTTCRETTLSGCFEVDQVPLDIPCDDFEITSVEVTPSTLSQTETGMTDQFFTITIQLTGNVEEVDLEETRVFIQDSRIDAVYQTSSIAADTITLEEIPFSWFQSQPVGTYQIGATVQTISGEPVTQLDLATITITE